MNIRQLQTTGSTERTAGSGRLQSSQNVLFFIRLCGLVRAML